MDPIKIEGFPQHRRGLAERRYRRYTRYYRFYRRYREYRRFGVTIGAAFVAPSGDIADTHDTTGIIGATGNTALAAPS